MKDHFGPEDMRTLFRAFDLAWTALGDDITGDRDALRDHMGRALIHLAQDGHLDEVRLDTYAPTRAAPSWACACGSGPSDERFHNR